MQHLSLIPAQISATRGADIAVKMNGEGISFSELDRQSINIAGSLQNAGLSANERVCFLDKNSLQFFGIFFGTLRAGGVMVGVNYRLAAPEIEYVISDSQARFVFVGESCYDLLEKAQTNLTDELVIIDIDGKHPEWISLDAWTNTQGNADQLPSPREDADVLQLYTSGTTGKPKGAVIKNKAWFAFAESAIGSWAKSGPEDRQLICMPLCHIAGINSALLGFYQGSSNILTREVIPSEIIALFGSERITYTLLAPVIIQALLAEAKKTSGDYSSMRQLSYGASPIAPIVLDEARSVFDCEFIHLYGLTECLGGATFLAGEDHDESKGKLSSCGKAYPGSAIRIIKDNETCAANEVGEIQLKSPWSMSSYWQRPQATAETFDDGWLRSGDAGYLDEDGYLFIHDRIKDMIVTGSENVYPAEVENALYSHSDIVEAAVIGVPDEKWGEAVKAVVVCGPDNQPSEAELIEFCRQHLAGFKTPKSVDFIDALPRNASGKVLKRELRQPYWKGIERQVN